MKYSVLVLAGVGVVAWVALEGWRRRRARSPVRLYLDGFSPMAEVFLEDDGG